MRTAIEGNTGHNGSDLVQRREQDYGQQRIQPVSTLTAFLWSHSVAEFGTPIAIRKCCAIFNSFQDTVRLGADFVMAWFEADGGMDDSATLLSGIFCKTCTIFQHFGYVHKSEKNEEGQMNQSLTLKRKLAFSIGTPCRFDVHRFGTYCWSLPSRPSQRHAVSLLRSQIHSDIQ